MSSPAKLKDKTAAEFLVVCASGVLMESERVKAVMVIVAYQDAPDKPNGTVAMNAWGGTAEGQVAILRSLAESMEQPPGAAALRVQ